MLRTSTAVMVAVGLFFATLNSCTADSQKEQNALVAAQQWLAMIDNEAYANSWENAAELFKSALSSQHWEQRIRSVRKPLGNLISRKVIGISYRSSLPGAPDGEYVVIQFNTAFDNKNKAIETVTPMMDPDGVWRVSGYYIK